MDLAFAALSDIGRHRVRNEDRCLASPDSGLFGVADGVGGLPGGETASRLACETLEKAVQAEPASGDARDILVRAVHRANEAVVAAGWQISPATGIATTLTVGRFGGGRLALVHVGDSRCYGWTAEGFQRLTRDHSEMHALTRCVGQRQALTVDLVSRALQPGDRFLFCTDGMSGEMSDAELAAVGGQDGEPEDILRELVSLALARGGADNISGVFVRVG